MHFSLVAESLAASKNPLYQLRDDYIDNAHLGLKNVLGGYDEQALKDFQQQVSAPGA